MADPRQSKPLRIVQASDSDYPEVYSDSVELTMSVYGLNLIFAVVDKDPKNPRPVASVRMSPQHAWVLCQVLRKNLRTYEDEIAKINLPDGLITNLGLDKEL